MADKSKPLTVDDLPAPSGDLSVDSLPSPPTAASIPTMQAGTAPTIGQRISQAWSSPIPGLTTKSPKEITTDVAKGVAESAPIALMAGPAMTEGLGATALSAIRGLAGAEGGAYLGRRGGEELGRLVGAQDFGGKVGGALGSIVGGVGAIKSPEMLEGYIGRLMGKGAAPVGVGVVGSAAQEAGYEPPVMKIPIRSEPAYKLTPEQVPGPDTAGKGNLLTPLARRGDFRAGAELVRRGRSVISVPAEDYTGTAAEKPRMKIRFPKKDDE